MGRVFLVVRASGNDLGWNEGSVTAGSGILLVGSAALLTPPPHDLGIEGGHNPCVLVPVDDGERIFRLLGSRGTTFRQHNGLGSSQQQESWGHWTTWWM